MSKIMVFSKHFKATCAGLLWVAGGAFADISLTINDGQSKPIAGVTCSQSGGGASATTDAVGKLILSNILGIATPQPVNQNYSLSQIPLSYGEKATLTIRNTKGQVVLSRMVSLGERVVFNQKSKGVYFANISSPNFSTRGQFINMDNGTVFETVKANNKQFNSAAKTAAQVSITCSKNGFASQVYRIADGSSMVIDFSKITLVPMYDQLSKLEPETIIETDTAIITMWADRARDRHAREDHFHLYDHYLTHYWEHRTARIYLTDYVAKGGNKITIHVYPEFELDAPEFRAFYRGIGTVAEYHSNISMKKIDRLHYTTTLTYNNKENRALRIGDRMEIEVSQFLAITDSRGVKLVGRDNYYGTTVLYMIGKGGYVPWEAKGVFGDASTEREDSYPLPEMTWTGGRTTLPYQYSNEPLYRFMQLAQNMAPQNGQQFVLGRRVLHTNFVTGAHDEPDNPVWTEQAGKGGPHFINTSCNSCHVRNGRSLPPAINADMYNFVVKVGDAMGNPHPQIGGALQPQNSAGKAGEGEIFISGWTESNGLRKPVYKFTGAVVPTNFSVRASPQLVGMGLLDAIPESNIQALEDPSDANGDGISGRMSIVTDPENGFPRLGRFGWKAGKASVAHQVAGAFNSDMGVMTKIFPKPDCGSAQTDCGNTSGKELDDTLLQQIIDYTSLLGVSARRDYKDPTALHGEALFASAGCATCHIPTQKTSAYHPKAELRNQTIHPYTDLLLHDMGPDLADNLPEGTASGAEWRTAPLWSIGLTSGVSEGEAYLHDGRARTIGEAILWHGGEGEKAANNFKAMSDGDKEALIKFIKSL